MEKAGLFPSRGHSRRGGTALFACGHRAAKMPIKQLQKKKQTVYFSIIYKILKIY